MLEFIKKRSGIVENFQASKTNGWVLVIGHDILDRMDWSSIVIDARNKAPESMTSQEWQMLLINELRARGSKDDGWPYMLMAGRLYTVYTMKLIHGDSYPHLQQVMNQVAEKGLARSMQYAQEDIDFLNDHVIDHEANMRMAWSQVEQYNTRYSLKDRVTQQIYETPQFANMRMAMSVYEFYAGEDRMSKVIEMYTRLKNDKFNPPSPNYSALGTSHYGIASCCLIAANDDAQSIKIAGMICYDMTLSSGGLGMSLSTRAPGDPVDNGRVAHAGRLNYIRKLVGDTTANKQGPRGGAINFFDTIYNPEAELSAMIQNPRTPSEVRDRRLNITYTTNPLFTRKAARGEDYFTFTEFSAPDLYKAFFKADQTEFEELYAKYEADDSFKKDYRDAADTLSLFLGQEIEVSTMFWANPSEMNRHTPFKDPVNQSNLCVEITNPVTPWKSVQDLYKVDCDPADGEVGICNIGSIPVHNHVFNPANPLEGYDDYKASVRAQYELIDYAIDNSEYHYPAIHTQAISRRNAAVGMSGLATLLAQLNLPFNSPEGRRVIHMLSERHAYACIEVALEMGIERGNAPWMHRTKWPEGWLPIDTYKKKIDTVVDSATYFPWEEIRSRIIANGGIRFSSLIAHMPGEQATRKGTGSNSIYPLFNLSLDLSDGSSAKPWAALDNDLIGHQYQNAYELTYLDQVIHYGIIQKWADQSISADTYEDRRDPKPIESTELVKRHVARVAYGMKTKYYTRSLTAQAEDQADIVVSTVKVAEQERPSTSMTAESVLERIAASAKASMENASGQSCTLDGNCGT